MNRTEIFIGKDLAPANIECLTTGRTKSSGSVGCRVVSSHLDTADTFTIRDSESDVAVLTPPGVP